MWEEKLDSGIQRKEASFSFNMIRKGFRKKWHLVWVLKKVSIGNGASVPGGRDSRRTGENIFRTAESQVWLEVRVLGG